MTTPAGPSGLYPVNNLVRIRGNTGVAGPDETWQSLSANSADNTTTTLAVAMTTQRVGPGTWRFYYTILCQTAAIGTGIKFAVNHTGTVTQFASHWRYVDTTATASTGTLDNITAAAAAGVVGGYAESVKDTATAVSAGVSAANTDLMVIMEGMLVVSVSGNLELKFASEVAASAARIMADSILVLERIA